MSDDQPKKRLMNEILPAPTPREQKSPRERALAHMKKLLAGVATTAALSSCGGFQVVDPIPPPSRCPEVLNQLSATALFVDQGGQLLIELRLTPQDPAAGIQLQEGAFLSEGQLLDSTLDPATGELVLLIAPPEGAVQLKVTVNAICLDVFGSFVITLDLPELRAAGDPVDTLIEAPENF